MRIKLEFKNVDWWLWTITLAFIIVALTGWIPGYYIVIGISLLQIPYFALRQQRLVSFDTQVRIVYFALSLFGLWEPVRFPFYILLAIGTVMVVLLGRCSIAMALRLMPWNKKATFCSLEKK